MTLPVPPDHPALGTGVRLALAHNQDGGVGAGPGQVVPVTGARVVRESLPAVTVSLATLV